MKKIIIHILIVLGLFFVIDRILGIGLKYLYCQSNGTDEYKISYSNESVCDSVLIFGSSRALHHYVPSIFEKELGLSCYNVGDWGIKNIYYHYGLLCNILTRYTPKVIVFEIHPCDWLKTPYSGLERANSLAPYCGMSKGCDEMLKMSSQYWPCKLSIVYRYTGSLPNLLAGKYGTMDRSLNGWKPMDGVMDKTDVVAEEYPFPKDEERITILKRFIQDCKKNDIQLILTFSPMYVCSNEDILRFPRDLAMEYHLPFFDHYRDSEFVGHSNLFYDFGHLNRKGAIKFSGILAKEINDCNNSSSLK